MRSFIAIIAIAAIIGLTSARHEYSVQAETGVGSAFEKISDIALRPLAQKIPIPTKPRPKPPVNLSGELFDKRLTAQKIIVVDHVTDTVLFEKNSEEAHPLASITKLMSALILTEYVQDWNATSTITAADIAEGNQSLSVGEVYTNRDLFDAALIGSINTAVNTLVRSTGMTQLEFVEKMNQRAVDLGMHKMHFADPTGLSPDNVASARDVARLTKIILSHPQIKVTSVTRSATVTDLKTNKKKRLSATDLFLNEVVPLKNIIVEGGKTGFINESGYNFTVDLKHISGNEIRVVVLGAQDVYSRFTETATLAEWVFEKYTWVK